MPDISVSVADTGEGAVFPGWLYELLDHAGQFHPEYAGYKPGQKIKQARS